MTPMPLQGGTSLNFGGMLGRASAPQQPTVGPTNIRRPVMGGTGLNFGGLLGGQPPIASPVGPVRFPSPVSTGGPAPVAPVAPHQPIAQPAPAPISGPYFPPFLMRGV